MHGEKRRNRCWVCGKKSKYVTDRGIELCPRHHKAVPGVFEDLEKWGERVGAKFIPRGEA